MGMISKFFGWIAKPFQRKKKESNEAAKAVVADHCVSHEFRDYMYMGDGMMMEVEQPKPQRREPVRRTPEQKSQISRASELLGDKTSRIRNRNEISRRDDDLIMTTSLTSPVHTYTSYSSGGSSRSSSDDGGSYSGGSCDSGSSSCD